MRRPGPLQDLPLDQFIPSSSKSSTRPNKRPLSPGAPNLFSPTKRRILEEEGIFSPEKTTKSPFPPSRGKGSAHFSALLSASDSPARRLDFAPSKPATTEEWRRINEQDRASLHSSLKQPPVKHSAPVCPTAASSFEEFDIDPDESDAKLSSFPPSLIPRMVPREMPPPPDPQSLHYPGFTICQDTHIILPHASDLKQHAFALSLSDEELENVAPRRKIKKAVTVPLSPSADLTKLDLGGRNKARDLPITPKNLGTNVPSPTPRRSATILSPMSAMTPRADAGTRRELRRLLEEEVDVAEGHDDDDETLY